MKLGFLGLFVGTAFAANAHAAGDAAAGAATFEDRCAICHVAAGGGQGPSLTGVVGRKAASAKGFGYSTALKASGLTWTAAALDVFLTNPGKAVPGTAMPIRVSDATQRANLIAYFAKHK
jgi:cytochrome c2